MRIGTTSFNGYRYAWIPLTGTVTYGLYQGYHSYSYIYTMMRYTSENQGRNYSIPRYFSLTTINAGRFIGTGLTGTLITYYSYKGLSSIFLARKPSIHRVSSISTHPIIHTPPPSVALPLLSSSPINNAAGPSRTTVSLFLVTSLTTVKNHLQTIGILLGPRATSQSYREFIRTYGKQGISLFLSICISITLTPILIATVESWQYVRSTTLPIPWGNQRRIQNEQKRREEERIKYLQEKREEEIRLMKQQLPSLFTGSNDNDP